MGFKLKLNLQYYTNIRINQILWYYGGVPITSFLHM